MGYFAEYYYLISLRMAFLLRLFSRLFAGWSLVIEIVSQTEELLSINECSVSSNFSFCFLRNCGILGRFTICMDVEDRDELILLSMFIFSYGAIVTGILQPCAKNVSLWQFFLFFCCFIEKSSACFN